MVEENISQEFQNIIETRNYFLEEIEQNELMSKKLKKVCTTLNYNQQFFILASTITAYILLSDFAPLLGILIGVMSSAIGLTVCAIAAGIKNYKTIIKKNNKKVNKIVVSKI